MLSCLPVFSQHFVCGLCPYFEHGRSQLIVIALDQGSTNYSPGAKSSHQSLSLKSTFTGTQLCTCLYDCLWLLSPCKAEVSNCDQDQTARKASKTTYCLVVHTQGLQTCCRLCHWMNSATDGDLVFFLNFSCHNYSSVCLLCARAHIDC